jgi:hypothetical protein
MEIFKHPAIKTFIYGAIGAALAYAANDAANLPFSTELNIIIGTIAAQAAHFFQKQRLVALAKRFFRD